MKTLWRDANMVRLNEVRGWGLESNSSVLCEDGRITWIGHDSRLPAGLKPDVEHVLQGALLTPGLIDCHTHLIYGGQRAHEFEQRLQGATYEQISRAGGGIRSTVLATRACSDEQLFLSGLKRARVLLNQGVSTLEIKSGYGLSQHDEARCLAAARRIGRTLPLTVTTTYLAAHALPPEYADAPDAYIDALCAWLPGLHADRLVDAVDAFCERIAFSPAQTRRVFEAAKALGLPVKLHAEQLSDQQGAALAAEFAALSCDHLEFLSNDGVAAMARAGCVAVLLPSAFYFLRETKVPPIAALRAAGVPIALATDHNPGSSPGLSPLLILNMACTLFQMTPEEALRGITVNAARALGLRDRGSLVVGQRADFAVWDLDHPNELAYWFGWNPCKQVIVGGERVAGGRLS